MAWYNRGIRSFLYQIRPDNLLRSASLLRKNQDVLCVDWINKGEVKDNWGDALAPVIVSWLSGKEPINQRDVFIPAHETVHTTIGSMLGTIDRPRVSVWGTGFVSADSTPRGRNYNIAAVRGPLTRSILLKHGIQCPECYGDPALLFPRLYDPGHNPTYKLGIIPHYKERGLPVFAQLAQKENISIIDICGGIKRVADEVNKCEHIISGSLHGLVLADAYKIPTMWLRLTDRPFGGGFKFHDYMASVGREHSEPVHVTGNDTADSILAKFRSFTMELDIDRFLETCPFLDPVGMDARAAQVMARYA